MKEIGVGVIGLGMGQCLLALNEDPTSPFVVRGVCARSEASARRCAERYGIPFWTTDYRALVDRDDIDVIGVYSPDHLHAEHALAALRAGKHVVCTKPMVTSLEDALQIVELVRRTGRKFLVGQTMRFDPEFLAIHRMYVDGDLGEPLFAEAHYVHDMRPVARLTPWRVTAPQDLMFGGACHPIDILRWFLGDVEEVHAYGTKSGMIPGYPLEDNFVINLRFKNGVIGRILALYGLVHPPMPMMGVSIFGRKASMRADYTDLQGGHIEVVYDKTEGHPVFRAEVPPVTEGAYGHGQAVARYMRHFAACLRGEEEPSPGALDGAKTVAVGAAAWESIRTGRPVKVFDAWEREAKGVG